MKKKSITIIAGDYPTKEHQKLVFVQQLVHAMIEQGVTIKVIAPQSVVHNIVHKQKLLPKYSIAETESGLKYEVFRPLTISFGNIQILKRLSDIYNRHVLCRMLSILKSDILYAHFWSSVLPIYKFASKNKIPLFVACGEGDNALEEMVDSLHKDELKLLSSSVTGVISVSSENKRKCIEYGLSKKEDIEVFPNCVNTSLFYKQDVQTLKIQLGINDDDFVIAFVGGFIPRKGPDRVAMAIKKINDPKIKVMFIGRPFPGYPYDFDCPGIVHKGPLNHDLLPKYINCADVFVLPTQKEGCCNAIVEALAIGLPVVSSHDAFNDDILNEGNSIRLDPNDIDAIAEAICLLRDNRTLRMSMSDYSQAHHSEYSIYDRSEKILTFINTKINEKLY